MIKKFMSDVEKYAKENNIDFVLTTKEGTVQYGNINDEPVIQKEPTYLDLAKVYSRMIKGNIYEIKLIDKGETLTGDIIDTRPAIYLRYDKEEYKCYISIETYSMINMFEIIWYLKGGTADFELFNIGIILFITTQEAIDYIGVRGCFDKMSSSVFTIDINERINDTFGIVSNLEYANDKQSNINSNKWRAICDRIKYAIISAIKSNI